MVTAASPYPYVRQCPRAIREQADSMLTGIKAWNKIHSPYASPMAGRRPTYQNVVSMIKKLAV